MRGLILLVVVAGCSRHEEPHAKVLKGTAASTGSAGTVPVAPVDAATAADRLVDHMTCAPVRVPLAAWAGKWAGERPFDNANPMAHRGPTQVTISVTSDQLSVSEGVGANAYTVALQLEPDGLVASGHDHKTRTVNAVSLDTGSAAPMTITTDVSLAACFDAHKALHMWRVLDASGTGIQAVHEEDAVVLAQVP